MKTIDRRIFLTAVGLAAWWVLVLAPDASAYIDPSTGGMLVQLLLAGTAGVAVLIKLCWFRIRRMIGLPVDESSPADAQPPSAGSDSV